MIRRPFDFQGSDGLLSGVLELPGGTPRAHAVFAHCFTCDKTSLAATRISRALTLAGIAVLRFDFTGLGASEGQFGAGLSRDIDDLVRAVAAMTAAGMAPALLIGHSLGGAAALAATSRLDQVRAVVTIGAPFDAEHVLHLVGDALDDAAPGARVPVTIGGRSFQLGSDFVADIKAHRQQDRIARLGAALLVLHAPLDETVGIANASGIFLAARHPKSFVALDGADHLLRRKADADYAAAVIAAWASRYLAPAPVVDLPATGVRVEDTGAGKFQVRVATTTGSFLADEPESVGGMASGPTPFDLLGAGLGACTAMTVRLYAERKGWPLERTIVEVGHTGRTAASGDVFARRIAFAGNLDAEQRARLLEIADKCPVHRTLTEGATVTTALIAHPDDGAPDQPEAHMAEMEQACAD